MQTEHPYASAHLLDGKQDLLLPSLIRLIWP